VSTCAICHHERPTAHATFRTNTGLVLFRSTKRIEAMMCFSCARLQFHQSAAHNLLFSWWGIISFLVTPFVLGTNAITYMRVRKRAVLTREERMNGPSPLRAAFLALLSGLPGLLALLLGSSSLIGVLTGYHGAIWMLALPVSAMEIAVAAGLLLTSAALVTLSQDAIRA
jgi:hypothetical protein